jgi:hypothetical protein
MEAANNDEARVIESDTRVRPAANAAKVWANRLATMALIAAALYLLSILVTGGYERRFGPITLDATKAWPAIAALLVLLLVRLRLKCASFRELARDHGAFVIFCIALTVYLANGRTIAAGDSVPAKLLPQSILRHGNFYLDEFPEYYSGTLPWYLRHVNGHYVSYYPVGAAIFAVPFYVPSVVFGVSRRSRIFAELEKISAAAIVALSVALVYSTAARLSSPWMAAVIAIAYAFGTSSLSVSAQSLWQHGPAQLALSAGLYCLVRARKEPYWAAIAGFPLAVEVITRPPDVLIAAPLAVYVLIYYRRELWTFIGAALPPLFFQLWYNAKYFGDPLRIQFFREPGMAAGQLAPGTALWDNPLGKGLAAVLLSPARGLLFYSPVLIFSLVALCLAWRRGGDGLLRCLGIGVVLTVTMVSKWHSWEGGFTYGPRLLADLTPALALALYPLEDWLIDIRAARIAFAALLAWSITAHSVGAFFGDHGWTIWAFRDEEHRFWLVTDNPVVDAFRRSIDSERIAIWHLPTSRSSPGLLRASCDVRFPASITAAPRAKMDLPIRATNAGKAVWLAHSADGNGAVRLKWEWLKDGQALPGRAAMEELHLDIFPNESIDLEVADTAPREPGDYELAISLQCEGAGRFSDLGASPVIAHVRVK